MHVCTIGWPTRSTRLSVAIIQSRPTEVYNSIVCIYLHVIIRIYCECMCTTVICYILMYATVLYYYNIITLIVYFSHMPYSPLSPYTDAFDPDSHTLGKEHHPYGQPFPGHDYTRPLCNVNYQKLVIIIDWKSTTTTTANTFATNTTSSTVLLKATTDRNTIGNLNTSSTTSTPVAFPIDRFDIHLDDESYTKHHNSDGSIIDRRSVTLQECLRVFASVDGEELDADTWTCDKV